MDKWIWPGILFGIVQVQVFSLYMTQIRTSERLEAWVEWLKAIWSKKEEG